VKKRDKARGAARGPARALRGEFFIRYKKPKAWGEGPAGRGVNFCIFKMNKDHTETHLCLLRLPYILKGRG